MVASGLLFGTSVMMAVWGASTLSRADEFGAATDHFSASHPDFDVTGWYPFAFEVAAVVSLVFAAGFSALGLLTLRGVAKSRALTVLAACAALPFVYLTYQDYGTPYLFPGDQSGAAGPMRALTPWRYAGWYHDLTIGLGVLVMTALVLVIALLAFESSKSRSWRRRLS